MKTNILLGLLIPTTLIKGVLSWGAPPWRDLPKIKARGENPSRIISRSRLIQGILVGSSSLIAISPQPSSKVLALVPSKASEKLVNLSNEEISNIVRSDVVDKAFLATANLTREIYDEKASFTDEIDTYSLEKWITGTKKLFNGEKSRVRLVGNVEATSEEVKFRFDEDLMFRIPFNPVVTLSGIVVLKRDTDTGLITSYREYWDQDVATVLKSAKFF